MCFLASKKCPRIKEKIEVLLHQPLSVGSAICEVAFSCFEKVLLHWPLSVGSAICERGIFLL
jgi:hypothetical protein